MSNEKSTTMPSTAKINTPVVETTKAKAEEKKVVETPVVEEVDEQSALLVYRHKAVSRFSCGGFEFVDHLCYVKEVDEAKFLKVYETLTRKDQINIVRLPAVPVELPVHREENKSVVRGAMTAPVKKR